VTPFVAAAVVSLINLLLVVLALPETHTNRIQRKVSIRYTFVNIKTAFTFKQLRTVFIALFLVNLGWVLFEYFFQVFLYGKFHIDASHIAYLFVYLGFWIVLSQGYIVRKVSNKISAARVLKFTLLPTAIMLMVVIFADKTVLWFMLPVLAIFTGFTQPNFSAILSDSTEKQSQGEILGIRQSVVSAAQGIAPLVGGFLMNIGNVSVGYQNPLIAGSLLAFIGWIFIMFVTIPKNKISFSEIKATS
jgi:predicted MFS family arabinose efflux permease